MTTRQHPEKCPYCSSAKPPSEVTAAADEYFRESARTLSLFHFVVDRALSGDYVSHVASVALAETSTPPVRLQRHESPVALAQAAPGPATTFLRRNQQALLQMIFVREVENFETYLSDVIREGLRARPELLRSRDEVRLDYVLRFEDMSSMLEDLIDRKVADLAYGGLSKLSAWIQERMNVELVPDTQHRSLVAEAVETRNCIVHSRARVGPKYVRNVPGTPLKPGSVRVLDVEDIFRTSSALSVAVAEFDEAISRKFSLARKARSDGDVGAAVDHS